ncbi:hypothetical protein [Burkholderia multivorans]|uniref:hypothetical protein n=1 Tax=Burkholderia multivorans TaxID=87883 RepID=UPI0021C09946|nr:hypothetical protein [Burkholderia multivorans]
MSSLARKKLALRDGLGRRPRAPGRARVRLGRSRSSVSRNVQTKRRAARCPRNGPRFTARGPTIVDGLRRAELVRCASFSLIVTPPRAGPAPLQQPPEPRARASNMKKLMQYLRTLHRLDRTLVARACALLSMAALLYLMWPSAEIARLAMESTLR